MKILVISNLYAPNSVGGAEKVAKTLAEGMEERGHEVRVLTTQPKGEAQRAKVEGVEVEYIPSINLYRQFSGYRPSASKKALWHLLDSANPFMARQVAARLDEWRPDIVHTHNLMGFSPSVWSAARQRNLPVVHTLHDYYLLCPSSTMYKNGRRCVETHRCMVCRGYSMPRIRATRNVTAAVGVSNFILDRHLLAGCFSKAQVRKIIFNPCLERPNVGSTPKGDVGRLRLGYLGQLVPAKGVDNLLDAFSALPKGAAELLIAGTGEASYVESLKARATYPGVQWLGYCRPDVLLGQIDLLVVPSKWDEPAGLVIQEAMVHGVPTLGAGIGGIPEMISDGGWTYDGTIKSLTIALRKLSDNRRELIRKSAAVLARAKSFTLNTTLDDYDSVYRQLCAGNNRLDHGDGGK